MPDPVTGRWKRPRPEHTEGPARQLHEEDNLPQTSKKQATSATTTSVQTITSRGTLDELAERLRNFHDSARALGGCLQKHDVSRKTDQSMIEATRCMFHKLLGEARDDLDRLTPRLQEGLCTEIKQSEQRHSHAVILKENPCSRLEMPSENSVWRTSTDTPMPQSSSETSEHVVEDDPRSSSSCRYFSMNLENGKHEFKMSSFTTTILNLLFTEAEQKGKTRIFGCTLDLDQTARVQTSCLLS